MLNKVQILNKYASKLNVKFSGSTLYKNTSEKFRKQYGISLDNAPVAFVRNGVLNVINHSVHTFKGRTTEKIEYIPMCQTRGFFAQHDNLQVKGV